MTKDSHNQSERAKHGDLAVVEPCPSAREWLLKRVSEEFPELRCVGFSSATDALSGLQEFRFLAVVSSFDLPDLSGPEFAKRTLELDLGVPVLLLSIKRAARGNESSPVMDRLFETLVQYMESGPTLHAHEGLAVEARTGSANVL